MMVLWRIATESPSYPAGDLSGGGAEKFGARWNRRGTPMVYTSTTRALACLETIVHASSGDPLPLNRYLVAITVSETMWTSRTMFDPALRVAWNAVPAGRASLEWGTAWATSNTSLLAQVPSVIVPEEMNVLINPAHPDLSSVAAVVVRQWMYDGRLVIG